MKLLHIPGLALNSVHQLCDRVEDFNQQFVMFILCTGKPGLSANDKVNIKSLLQRFLTFSLKCGEREVHKKELPLSMAAFLFKENGQCLAMRG